MLSNAQRTPHPLTGMLFVSRLQSENFRLWNVGGIGGKVPVDRTGNPSKSWPSISAARLAKEHKKSSQQWGMPMGLHADNGKHILALDFDICGDKDKETGKRMGCPETKALLDENLANAPSHDGIFTGGTQGNMNVLIDYSAAQDIIDLVATNKDKFAVKSLEVRLRF